MKREFVDEVYLVVDDVVPYKTKITYYLLSEMVQEEFCDLVVYGAEIEKESYRMGNRPESERKIIKNLFFRRGEAEDFMKKLVKNKVTPMGLKFAVQEHIGEQIGAV